MNGRGTGGRVAAGASDEYGEGEMPDEQPRDGDDQQSKYNPEDLDSARKIISALEKRLGERDETITGLKSQVSEFAERMSAIEQAQKTRLEEQGNYQELARKYQADLEAVRPVAERAQALEAIIRDSNEARVQRIPEQQRGLIPVDYPPERLQAWLNANEALLVRPPAPDYNAGAGANGESVPSKTLSDAERRMAKLIGVTDAEFLAEKQRREKQE